MEYDHANPGRLHEEPSHWHGTYDENPQLRCQCTPSRAYLQINIPECASAVRLSTHYSLYLGI